MVKLLDLGQPIDVEPGDFGEWTRIVPATCYATAIQVVDVTKTAPGEMFQVPRELVWERIRVGIVDLMIPARPPIAPLPVVSTNGLPDIGMGVLPIGSQLSVKLYNGSDRRLTLGAYFILAE